MQAVKLVTTVAEIESCWEVVQALRPHLQRENFVLQVQEMMQDGYQMIYLSEDEKPVAFAGFRNMHMLYSGKIIYIDDLSTLPEYRGRGYAGRLLEYIHQLAKETGKQSIQLDSGYQRNNAHRLYLNKGYKLASHHFAREV
ncbi:MAG: GNAT family N-acetyltransferase [Chitinophagaceae bacterium]|nr:GNAT family N-acetyltransferase [Chitinophagaceae bacterium]